MEEVWAAQLQNNMCQNLSPPLNPELNFYVAVSIDIDMFWFMYDCYIHF